MEGRELPVGWATARLEEVTEILDSRRIPLNADERKARIEGKEEDELFPYYGATGQVGWIDDFLFDEQLILLGEDGVPFFDPLRHKAYLASGKFWVNNHAHVLRGITGLADQRYLTSYFNQLDYSGFVSGSTRLKLTQAAMRGIPVPLAPINEQRRIAVKLDSTLSAVDACRQRLDGVAAILKRFRQAVLAAATSGELTREWREENSVDEPWEYVNLSSVADSRLGKMLDQSKNTGRPTPYLRNINVRWFTFDLSDIQSIRINDNERRDLDVRYGDLLVCEGGEPGRCAVWRGPDSEYTFQKALHRIRPSTLLAADYLAYCIRNSADNGSLSELFTGTTIKHLTGRSLARYPVPLPSRKEQNEIIDQVENLFTLASQLEVRLTAASKVVDRLTPALLAKAFRGEMLPQDLNDEPASVLLERIRAASNARSARSAALHRGRRKATDHSEQSSLAPTPFPTNAHSRVDLVRTGDETTQGEGGLNRVSKSKPSDYLKVWSPMKKGLIQILGQHQGWISASKACEEMGISDGSSSEDLESFFRQLKEHVDGGAVDVQRRGDEDWLKLSSREVV